MTEPEQADRQSCSIVVLGDLNPAIFQPLWFSANGLMPVEEARAADISIIHKKFASFVMGQVQVQVDESRRALLTADSSQEPLLRDLAVGTLQVLEHTPLKAIGLNLDIVFNMESEDAWNAVGNRLAPKQDWDFITSPGMRQLVVSGKRSDCRADEGQTPSVSTFSPRPV